MGIQPVVYNGQTVEIGPENAMEILKHQDSVTQEDGSPISDAQIKWAEHFLSEAERDEVLYGDEASLDRGRDAISLDADKDGKDDIKTNEDGSTDTGEGAGAAAATAGTGAAVAGATILALCPTIEVSAETGEANGFLALLCGIAVVAGSAMALVFSFANIFDKGFDIRKAFSDATNDNAAKLDAQNDLLVGNMDLMNEDSAEYEEGCTEYADQAAGATNQLAALKVDLADAQAFGDTARANEIMAQIEALGEENGLEDMEEGLQGIRDRMEDYSSSAMEAQGMIDNGTKIAEFLDVGKKLKAMALVNAVVLTALTVVMGVAAIICGIPKMWAGFVPVDQIPATAGQIMYYSALAMLGYAAGKMFKNASDEGKFGDSGDVMHEHIDSLNDMISQHSDYMDETVGGFDGFDEDLEATQEQNAEAATGVVGDKTGDKGEVRVGGVKAKDDEYKKKHQKGGSVEPTHKPKPQPQPNSPTTS